MRRKTDVILDNVVMQRGSKEVRNNHREVEVILYGVLQMLGELINAVREVADSKKEKDAVLTSERWKGPKVERWKGPKVPSISGIEAAKPSECISRDPRLLVPGWKPIPDIDKADHAL